MNYTDIYDLKNPPVTLPSGQVITVPDLKKKVTVAIATAAQQILAEAESTANHPARARWARQSLATAEAAADQIMWAVLGNPVIQTSGNAAADSDIQFVVNGAINLFAV